MMKNITMILTNGFDPDPRVYKEAQYLLSKGFSITILCWDRETCFDYPQKEEIDGINVVRFKHPSETGSGVKQIPAFIRYIRDCKRFLANNQCNFLHCNDLDGALVGYLSTTRKLPKVFDLHEFYERGNKIQRFLWRRLTIFLLNKSIAGIYENNAYLGKTYSGVKCPLFELRNYPDKNMVEARPKSNSIVFRIGYHGAIRSQYKEFVTLFDAAKEIPNVRIDVNGGGPDYPKLKQIEKKYQNVFVNGPYDGTKVMSELYEKTDVLFCGYSLSIPNFLGDAEVVKFYEAIITGTPMIITAGTGMAGKVQKNGYGIACDTTEVKSVKKAITKFINDREFLQECSKNELRDSYKYCWQDAVKVLDKIYR